MIVDTEFVMRQPCADCRGTGQKKSLVQWNPPPGPDDTWTTPVIQCTTTQCQKCDGKGHTMVYLPSDELFAIIRDAITLNNQRDHR